PPERQTPTSNPMVHCHTAASTGRATSARATRTTISLRMVALEGRLVHHQIDPAVRYPVLALHEPVVSGIELPDDYVLHGVPDQLVIALEERSQRLPDAVCRPAVAEVLPQRGARIVPGGESCIQTVDLIDDLLESVLVRLDLTGGVIVFHDEHANVLPGMCRVVLIELLLGEEQHLPRPVQVVLIEEVRARLSLAGALIARERIGLPLLSEDVHLKFGGTLQPAFKVLHEMGFGHVQTGRWRRRRGGRLDVATAAIA